MTTDLLRQSGNWVVPSLSTTPRPTIPNYEEELPLRLNRDGVKNYMKNRGTFNLSDWAVEGRRASSANVQKSVNAEQYVPPPKVIGTEAIRNYTKGVSSTPNLIHGNLQPPNPHHHMRVKKEGFENYKKDRHSTMKLLFEKYGKFPLPQPPPPQIFGQKATDIFYAHKEGRTAPILNNYGHLPPSPRPIPNVIGTDAENNLLKSYGEAQILEHPADFRPPPLDPHVMGEQGHNNFDKGIGRQVNKLFYNYGKLPQSARVVPKVKYDGVPNFVKAQGDAMRKTISQCPPSHRPIQRSQSSLYWA